MLKTLATAFLAFVLASAISIALPSSASARHGGGFRGGGHFGGHYGGHFGGFRGGRGYYGYRRGFAVGVGAPYYWGGPYYWGPGYEDCVLERRIVRNRYGRLVQRVVRICY